MIKKITPAFFIWISCLLTACAGQPFGEPISNTEIFKIPDTPKETLFQTTELWMKENFKIGSSEVVTAEPNKARVIGRNKSLLHREPGIVYYVWYTLKVEAKDSKVRVTSTITDTAFATTNDTNSHHSYMDSKIITNANIHVQKTINRLIQELKATSNQDDW